MASESTGTGVTVTVPVALTGTAKSPISERVAVVLYGPPVAVEAIATPTMTVERDDVAFAVQLNVVVPLESEQVQVEGDGEDAKLSPAGTVTTSFGW